MRVQSRPADSICAAMLLKVVYWLAVVAISLAFVVLLISFLESRDQGSVDEGRAASKLLARSSQPGRTWASVVPSRAASRWISEGPGIWPPLR